MLEWASMIALEENWGSIDWSMDAKKAVDLIMSDFPGGWDSHIHVANIRARFLNQDWILCWNPRCTNRLADAIAKNALVLNASCHFSVSSLEIIPRYLLSLLFWTRMAFFMALICKNLEFILLFNYVPLLLALQTIFCAQCNLLFTKKLYSDSYFSP